MGLKLESKSETESGQSDDSGSSGDGVKPDWFAHLVEASDLEKEELEDRVQAKIDEYEGLVNKGAASILVARELDIQLVELVGEELELSYIDLENVVCEMRDVNVKVKVENVPPESFVNSFDGGKVVNVKVSDSTGVTKLALWNEAVDSLFPRLKEGMELKIKGASTSSEEKNEYHFNTEGFDIPQLSVNKDTKVVKC